VFIFSCALHRFLSSWSAACVYFLNKTFLDLLRQKGAARKIYSSPELAGGGARVGGWVGGWLLQLLSLIAANLNLLLLLLFFAWFRSNLKP
jgi:hypothetical protein